MTSRYPERLSSPLSSGVRLWWVDLDAYASIVPLDGLDAADHDKAMRMANRQDAQRTMASRHVLRQLLSDALGTRPEDVTIAPDRFGKPQLSDRAINFNLSHSEQYALIGLSHTMAIGVDIEVVRPVPDADAIVAEHFSGSERSAWSCASAAQRNLDFFACWTRKEALAKALGTGFRLRPSLIDVGCSPDIRRADIRMGASRCEVTVASLELSCRTAAAVAVAAPQCVELARDYVGPARVPIKES